MTFLDFIVRHFFIFVYRILGNRLVLKVNKPFKFIIHLFKLNKRIVCNVFDCAAFVKQIYSLIGQLAVKNISVRHNCRRFDSLVAVAYLMVIFIVALYAL